MSNPCACTPGTEENGWHEVRCDECLAHEIMQWEMAVQRFQRARQEGIRMDEFQNLRWNGYRIATTRITNLKSL